MSRSVKQPHSKVSKAVGRRRPPETKPFHEFAEIDAFLHETGSWAISSPAEGEPLQRENLSHVPAVPESGAYKTIATSFEGNVLTNDLALEELRLFGADDQTTFSQASKETEHCTISPKSEFPISPSPRQQPPSPSLAIDEFSPALPRNTCICGLWFKTAELLEQHARAAFHRLDVCPEQGCTKSYYRRDAYTRHKSTHKQRSGHECWACSLSGVSRYFSRKDHLNQHMRNCHSDKSWQQWDLESAAFPFTWGTEVMFHSPKRCDSPMSAMTEVSDKTSTRPLDTLSTTTGRPPSVATTCSTLARSHGSRCGYQSQAVAELENAFTSGVAQGPHELQVLKEQLNLHDGMTTEQLAWKLRELLIQIVPLASESTGLGSSMAQKRKAMR